MKWSVMLLCWLGMFFGAERLPLSAAEDKPHTLFYLDDNRLIAFRLQITVDGKPFGETWEKFLGEFFEKLVKDQDRKLSAQELGRLTKPRLLYVLRGGQGATRSSRKAAQQSSTTVVVPSGAPS